jgi:glycosyltransferase involved in cell wall biosynthesis
VGIYGALVRCLPDAEFVVFEPADCRVIAWFDGAPNVSARATPIPSMGRTRKLIGGYRYWHSVLQKERFDLFEGFHLPLVSSPTGRTLLTIHDVRGLNPEYGALERAVFKTVLGKSLRAADHIVTVSEAMKAEILGFYPKVPISVIYNGLDTSEFSTITEEELLAFRRKFALPEGFILSVGHFEKRKNYLRLVDAIGRIRDRGRSYTLVIIGNNSGLKEAIQARAEAANLSGRVRLLSGLSDREVRCAYKLCRLFVFPSTYEGFGIPILEAMAAGCPMVLSDIPVFREITQGRGVYFHPQDVKAMALSIEHVLSSSIESSRLVEYGRKRVQAFSFPNLAANVARLYRKLK